MIDIWTIGGYSQIGKNMTAIRYKDEVVVCDMGLHMEKIVEIELKEGEPLKMSTKELRELGAIPNDEKFFKKWGKMVKAIAIGHAHLDHVGAVVKMADRYKTKLIMTSFTAEVLDNMSKNEKIRVKSKIIRLNQGSKYKVSDNITIEFITMTHSTPQTATIAIHTPEGPVLYAVDWKFDNEPGLGQPPNYKRLEELGKKGVLALISDTTRVENEMRTYSEGYVKQMFKDTLGPTKKGDHALFVVTFSSHIARIKMLVEMARSLGREPVIFGRSMHNYISAAERAGIVKMTSKSKVFGFRRQIAKVLRDVNRERGRYFVICTGCQGEPGSIMQRLSVDEFPFEFEPDDQVIFSCSVIPTKVNQENRSKLESDLKRKQVRIFKDLHQSGHASREDVRDLLKLVKPKHFIPTHGGMKKLVSAIDLAKEEGYILNKTSHILQDGDELRIEGD